MLSQERLNTLISVPKPSTWDLTPSTAVRFSETGVGGDIPELESETATPMRAEPFTVYCGAHGRAASVFLNLGLLMLRPVMPMRGRSHSPPKVLLMSQRSPRSTPG